MVNQEIMRTGKRSVALVTCLLFAVLLPVTGAGQISEATDECLTCHEGVTPGIVADWRQSRHAKVTPAQAMELDELARRVSAETVPESLTGVVVGCAECHTLDPDSHGDSFEHNDYTVHTVVSPRDCATCHPVEHDEYGHNLMSHAYANLKGNELYRSLIQAISCNDPAPEGQSAWCEHGSTLEAGACLACHGTVVEVVGSATRETDFGEMDFPILSGWPNRGVGRINPDGSRGACTPCHSRHSFSLKVARKPYTCSQCHSGPDTPAYKVYSVSKHGNLFNSLNSDWDFEAVPWTVGRDFTAPTCAVCHIALVVDEEENVMARRTHRMNDRLDWRLFGLPYAHPHPIEANTTVIRNRGGLPLPTELTGAPSTEYLIDADERAVRRSTMQQVCRSCHSSQWVDGHFDLLDSTIAYTNRATLAATELLQMAWKEGFADAEASLFDEAVERRWVEQWLFYANNVRFAAAMAGADYGVFANGRWHLSQNVREMHDWLTTQRAVGK